MTHLCYTLEEAAERLNLSETVLVRLSQYFKVPQNAYEAVGYLSFKGDLTFTDQDIAFFKQVRECLLAGESLEAVKSRIRYESVTAPETPPAEPEPDGPLREVDDRAPYTQAVQDSFARYKEAHRVGMGRVFENLLRDVKEPAQATREEWTEPVRTESDEEPLVPFRATRKTAHGKSAAKPASRATRPAVGMRPALAASPAPALDAVWDALLQTTRQQPRTLSAPLKQAARQLREQVTGQPVV